MCFTVAIATLPKMGTTHAHPNVDMGWFWQVWQVNKVTRDTHSIGRSGS